MASNETAAILVARYLKANHYSKSLDAFLRETNLTEKAAATNAGDWTLEQLLEEKIQFDTSLNFEKVDNQGDHGWVQPAPSIPIEPDLPISTNVLCVSGSVPQGSIAITTANNTCAMVQSSAPYSATSRSTLKADSPMLFTKRLFDRFVVSTTMSGKVVIHDSSTGELISERRDHSKWAVHLASCTLASDRSETLVATAGWDQKINIHVLPSIDERAVPELQAPIDTITLQSNPESLIFVRNPDTNKLYLIVSRRDSSFLYYFHIDYEAQSIKTIPAGRQNLAPHSNAWVAFTPSTLALHPTDPTLVAIATSHLPHLKVIVVRLLFPDTPSTQGFTQQAPPETAAAQARADLALQDREDAAIILQVSTQAPQTPYSTPQISWRPDGSGVWVNGDDGVVRGVEVKTGKVVALLRAHEVGSKVRTLWAGYSNNENGEKRELLISGGFDKKVFIWEISKEGGNSRN